ncbi:unnamed protein product, partial [Didymodactylos carnosus]
MNVLTMTSAPASTRADKLKRAAWTSSSAANSYHLGAVPTATSINRNGTANKKKTFPLWFDYTDPSPTFEYLQQCEDLIPIRLDMEVDGQKLRDTFTWNKNGIVNICRIIPQTFDNIFRSEQLITPEIFAEILC